MPEMMPQHVSIVFKELFEELQAFKRQQWTIANYAILILAGTFALKDYFDLYLLGSIVWVTFAIASGFLLLIQWHMGRARARIDHIQKVYFTEEQLRDIGLTDRERANLDKQTRLRQSFRGGQFVAALIAVLFVGSSLVFGALRQAAWFGEP